jgi:hypothetical protein
VAPPHARATLVRGAEYIVGLGVIQPVSLPGRTTPADQKLADRRVAVHNALLGMLPGTDLALADLMRRLDTDTSADRFAAFLESWRNGDESFYQALDRTAGTRDSVFFFDAMLNDFAGEFAHKDLDPAGPRRSLQAAHDALHDAFLSYRQYRAFREAVAWSLVLPPDVPLPLGLGRYEQKPQGMYSLREQVVMVLALEDFDPLAVVRQVTGHADALPQPLWRDHYDPYVRWNEVFAGLVPRMLEKAPDTDAFLSQAQAQLRELATKVDAVARSALAASVGSTPTR